MALPLAAASTDELPTPGQSPIGKMHMSSSLTELDALNTVAPVDELPERMKRLQPPVAKATPHMVYECDGVKVYDDYYWFRERSNPKVLKYLEEENAYAEAMMEDTSDLQDSLYEEFMKRSTGVEKVLYQQVDDFYYYTRQEEDKNYPIHCRRFESTDNEEQVVLDENEVAEGEDFFSLGCFEISNDHNWLMYGVDSSGNEKFTLRFKNLSSGSHLDDELYDASWTARWAADNRTVLYTRVDDTGRSYGLYRHAMGEHANDGSDDELIVHEKDEMFFLRLTVSNSRRYFLLNIDGQVTKEVRYLSTATPKGEFQTIAARQHGVMYHVSHHGSYFYILTNCDGAHNFKVMKAHVDDPANKENWEEVLPHREAVLIERVDLFRHHFVAWEWEGGLQHVRVQDLSDGEVHYIQFSDSLYAVWPGEKPDMEDTLQPLYFNSNTFVFSYSSFVQPTIVYEYDMDNHRKRKKKEMVVNGYLKEEYHQRRIWATAPDGSQVPISLVYKLSLKNPAGNPLLLSGYGAYGGHKLPFFTAERLSLLDRGIVFALAHPRGDATCGMQWYEQGKFLNKKNTFDDFIACARFLIDEGYTTADRLAIYGRSAGGLLMGAALLQAPELFKAVVAEVPFLDVIGSMTDPTIPWTAFEWEEWGDPRDPKFFHYMLGYSPYANLRPAAYPHVLITTGLNDPRVCYWEPAKFTAKLRRVKTNNTALLLKTYLTGHMGASGRFDSFSELAFQYAFIIDKLGLIPSVTAQKPLMKVISTVSVTPPDLLAMFQGYQVSAVLFTALDLGVFNALHTQPNFAASCATLSDVLRLSSDQGLSRLLHALVAVGILLREGDNFALTEVAARHLVEGMPGFIGELRFSLANEMFWRAVRTLPDAIKAGRPVIDLAPDALSELVARHSMCASKHAALGLLQALSLSDAARKKTLAVLDLGCGNGVVGFTLAKSGKLSKNVQVVSMDSAAVLPIAKATATEMGVLDKVELREGNARTTKDLGGPYDLVILGQNTLSALDTAGAAEMLERISESLKSTGRLVLNETIASAEGPYAHLYSVALFATRSHGRVNNLAWFKQLLAQTGFSPPSVHDLRPFPEKLLVASRNIIMRHSTKSKNVLGRADDT